MTYNSHMDIAKHIDHTRLSHAYIVEGERESGLRALREWFASWGVRVVGNPDYHEYQFETLLLSDAQALRREQGMHGMEGAKKIFVVAFNAITHESAHALLKTLEEPTQGTHFFFLVRTGEMLLPTVRSRMQLIRGAEAEKGEHHPLAKEFLEGSIAKRLKMIASMTKAKTEEKPKAKEDARLFVGALEPILYQLLHAGNTTVAPALEDTLAAKRELAGRSPSVKLLLEHLALTLPNPLLLKREE